MVKNERIATVSLGFRINVTGKPRTGLIWLTIKPCDRLCVAINLNVH